MADVVGASDVHERLASITPCKDFLTLVVSQFRLAPNNAPSFGAFPAFTGGCGSIPAQTQQVRPAPLVSACREGLSAPAQVSRGDLEQPKSDQAALAMAQAPGFG